MKKIAITSFEASGDLHSSLLVKKLKQFDANIQFFGVGGHRLNSAGVSYFTDTSLWGVIGIWEALKKVPYLYFKVEKLKKEIIKFNPDLLILIDSPAINVRIAKEIKKHDIKMMYYFPPSVWRRENLDKARAYARLFDYIVAVFPETKISYQKVGKDAYYFGHPIADAVCEKNEDRRALRKKYKAEDKKLIGLLPGSRPHEVKFLLKEMLATANLIYAKEKAAVFVIPAANPQIKALIDERLKNAKIDFPVEVCGSSFEVMRSADLIITSSGTATLEAAFFLVPMIVLYKVNLFDCIAARIIYPYLKKISLPNVILGKDAVPEFLQEEIKPEKIAREALKILNDGAYREEMLSSLRRVKEKLASGGVVDKVARLALKIIGAAND